MLRPRALALAALTALPFATGCGPDEPDTDPCAPHQSTLTHRYDENGLRLETRTDRGDVRDVERFFHDEQGRLLKKTLDRDDDGVYERVELRRYDGERLVSVEVQAPGARWRAALFHDAAGRVNAVRFDGRPAAVEAVETDVLLFEAAPVLVPGLDLPADWSLLEAGVFDPEIRLTYDSAGRLASVDCDLDGDGLPDTHRRHTYAEREARLAFDADGDGVAERIDTMRYDDAGNLVEHAADLDADGVPDARRRLEVWTDLERQIVDRDGDGTPELTIERRYDAAGRLVLAETYDARGRRTLRESFAFDAEGRLARAALDHGDDGAEQVRTYHYDPSGRLEAVEALEMPLTCGGSVAGE